MSIKQTPREIHDDDDDKMNISIQILKMVSYFVLHTILHLNDIKPLNIVDNDSLNRLIIWFIRNMCMSVMNVST